MDQILQGRLSAAEISGSSTSELGATQNIVRSSTLEYKDSLHSSRTQVSVVDPDKYSILLGLRETRKRDSIQLSISNCQVKTKSFFCTQ
jgi:hypothetical protein